jgi:hypothetical protein
MDSVGRWGMAWRIALLIALPVFLAVFCQHTVSI